MTRGCGAVTADAAAPCRDAPPSWHGAAFAGRETSVLEGGGGLDALVVWGVGVGPGGVCGEAGVTALVPIAGHSDRGQGSRIRTRIDSVHSPSPTLRKGRPALQSSFYRSGAAQQGVAFAGGRPAVRGERGGGTRARAVRRGARARCGRRRTLARGAPALVRGLLISI